jgi:hypothetical protein
MKINLNVHKLRLTWQWIRKKEVEWELMLSLLGLTEKVGLDVGGLQTMWRNAA